MEPGETQEVDVVYDARESTWGHHVEWQRWRYLDNELKHQVGRFVGHLTPLPEPGQHFLMVMQDATLVLFVIEWLEYQDDPRDMFFCDATMLGAVTDEMWVAHGGNDKEEEDGRETTEEETAGSN